MLMRSAHCSLGFVLRRVDQAPLLITGKQNCRSRCLADGAHREGVGERIKCLERHSAPVIARRTNKRQSRKACPNVRSATLNATHSCLVFRSTNQLPAWLSELSYAVPLADHSRPPAGNQGTHWIRLLLYWNRLSQTLNSKGRHASPHRRYDRCHATGTTARPCWSSRVRFRRRLSSILHRPMRQQASTWCWSAIPRHRPRDFS